VFDDKTASIDRNNASVFPRAIRAAPCSPADDGGLVIGWSALQSSSTGG